MGNDDLAAAFRELFSDLHGRVDALAEGAPKLRAKRLLAVFHGAGDALMDWAADQGHVQPFGGTDKPNPGP